MEVLSDCDSIGSFDTVDCGFSLNSDGRIEIEEPSTIYIHKCSNCYRSFEADDNFTKFKYNYKRSDIGSAILYFCCKGCRLWGLYKLRRNKYRPRLSCTCKVASKEGMKYVPPTLSTPGRRYRILEYIGCNFIEELPVSLTEMFSTYNIQDDGNNMYRRRARSRSR